MRGLTYSHSLPQLLALSPETLKEDARRHGVRVLQPDANRSEDIYTIDGDALRLGLRYVHGVGGAAARNILQARRGSGPFASLADFLAPTGLQMEPVENLIDAGALDCFGDDRRQRQWELGLRYRPFGVHLPMALPVSQDMVGLPELSDIERMLGEYGTLGVHPDGHLMAHVRPHLPKRG